MPPVAAAVIGIGSAIGGIGSAAVGGIAALGSSALGGLAALGSTAIGGITSLGSPGYGVAGGLIGPATEPIGSVIAGVASKVAPLISTGTKLYQTIRGTDQPSAAKPTATVTPGPQVLPTNILGTLPDLVRPPTQQILTTPAPAPPENNLAKYLPIAAVLVIGFLILKGK